MWVSLYFEKLMMHPCQRRDQITEAELSELSGLFQPHSLQRGAIS